MTTPHTNPKAAWTAGRPTRAGQSLRPVTLEPELTDEGAAGEAWTAGAARRVCESLPPVALAIEEAVPALLLRANGDPAARADAVADALLKAVAHDLASGGSGFVRDRSREAAQSGTFVLVLVPNGPTGPDTEARLQEVAKLVTSPAVSAEVIPAA